MTAVTYIQPLRDEVLWHSARRFLFNAAAPSRISVIPHDLLQCILEPAGRSHKFSLGYFLNILTQIITHSLSWDELAAVNAWCLV